MSRRVNIAVCCAAVLLAVTVRPSAAQRVHNPANGHDYEVIGGTMTWYQARDLAAARSVPGAVYAHLVTVTSAAEWDFILTTVAATAGGNLSDHWLGGHQPNPWPGSPSAGWEWVTGEPWTFAQWAPGEPNDNAGAGNRPNGEDALQIYSVYPSCWNDVPKEIDIRFARGLIVEYEPIADTEPPTITDVSVDRPVLWPPNHKMVDVTVNYTVADVADPAPVRSLSVTSSEPENGLGDGDTGPDWEILDAHHVRLRAERAGNGSGRVYTITITCRDASGNVATKTVTVTVPKSQGK